MARGGLVEGIEVNVDREGDRATVSVAGEIDLTSAPRLDDEVTNLIEQSVGAITIELRGVSFMDSTGLRVLLKASKALGSSGGALYLREPSDAVRRLLDVSGLNDHFEFA